MIFKINDLVHHVRIAYPGRDGIYRIKHITDSHYKEYPYILESLDGYHRGIMSAKYELFKPNKFFLRLYGIID